MNTATGWKLSLFSLSLLCIIGCGPGYTVHPVTGTVTLDDTPLAGATVTFEPSGAGKPATGLTDSSGVYNLVDMRPEGIAGAEAGEYKISVHWIPPPAVDLSQATGAGLGQDTSKSRQITSKNAPKSKLPNAYNSSATSNLTATVKSGSNKVNLPLKSDFTGK